MNGAVWIRIKISWDRQTNIQPLRYKDFRLWEGIKTTRAELNLKFLMFNLTCELLCYKMYNYIYIS